MRPERRFKGRNGTGRPSIAALKTSNPRPRRTLAYCGRKMDLTMGTTLDLRANAFRGSGFPEFQRLADNWIEEAFRLARARARRNQCVLAGHDRADRLL